MKRILLAAPRRFETEEAAMAKPGPGQALVKIGMVGVCGSDIHLYRHGRLGVIKLDKPFVIGHECMGTVAEVGEGVDEALTGRRVAVEPQLFCGRCKWCRAGRTNVCPNQTFIGLPPLEGAMQEYLLHPASLLAPLPDSIGDEAAVVFEPLAVAQHAVRLAKIRPPQTVVILGTGVLGSCVLMILSLYRGLRVICTDLLPERLDRAAKAGALAVLAKEGRPQDAVSEVMKLTGPHGADVVIECSGADETLWEMCEVAAPGGCVAVVGTNPEDRISFSSGSARRKGLTIRFVRRSLNTLPDCIRLASEGAIAPETLVTHVFPASRAAEAFKVVDGYSAGVLKALIDMRKW